jgi:acetylcholinesterase
MLFDEGDTCGLFSGSIMVTIISSHQVITLSYLYSQQSGSPMRLPDVLDQQVYFDGLVTATNCTDAPDRFQCLRQAPFSALQSAVDASPGLFSYQSMRLAWTPMVDGTLIPRNPMQLVESRKIARVSCVGF